MPIHINLDSIIANSEVNGKTLASRVGITEQNLSLLRTGKVKGIRFSTLAQICDVLECQPGDIFEYIPNDAHK